MLSPTAWKQNDLCAGFSPGLLITEQSLTPDIQQRGVVELNQGWNFFKKRVWRWQVPVVPGQGGEVVDLPHTWNAQDDFQEGVTYYRGPGTYRKTFRLPAALQKDGLRWTLESGGFYGTGDVWLNGRRVGRVDGQYLGFALDVNSLLRRDDENQLCIRLTNRCRKHVLPGIQHPDFLLYGGLAGKLRLVGRPALHLLEHPQITYTDVLGPTPTAVIHFGVANRSAHARRCVIRWRIDASEAATELWLSPGEVRADETVRLAVPGAQLWSPNQPRLYHARGELLEDDLASDTAEIRFGFRVAEFRPQQGFFLNGARLDLRGVNRHENMPGFGTALPDSLHREDAQTIKNLGLNFIRLSHYPQSPIFLDACDELGLLVYAELASWKSVRASIFWLQNARRQFHDMILRDRHHPSVILWGMGNESQSRKAYLQLRAIARKLDPERPVTYAENHFYRAQRAKTVGLPDVWGCNYEFEALEQGRDAARLGCVVVSECSNYPLATRGNLPEELRQVAILEKDLARLAGKPFVAGFALWCLADYGTLRKNRYLRYSGLVDAWRLPKPAAALLQAYQANTPVVKVYGDWGLARGATQREIHVFTNCEQVTLICQGREVTQLRGARHYVCAVPFAPSELLAVGRYGDQQVTDQLYAFGPAHRLVVIPEQESSPAEGCATIGLRLEVLDVAGARVGDWHGAVGIDILGPARLRAYTPEAVVMVRGGVGRGFVTGTGVPGVVQVRAVSDTLRRDDGIIHFV